jgi:hypothetical protein
LFILVTSFRVVSREEHGALHHAVPALVLGMRGRLAKV